MLYFDDNDLAKNLTDAFLKPDESNNYKILEITRAQTEEYIELLHSIYEILNLDTAYGRTLDYYGEREGVARGEANDDQYRAMIKAKITRSLSNGTYQSVIKCLSVIFNAEIEEVDIIESKTPCTVDNAILPFRVLWESGLSIAQIMELIESLLPITVTLSVLDLTGTFEFSVKTEEYDELKGFSDENGEIGGYFGCSSRDSTEPMMKET